MRVKVGNTWYNAAEIPIMLEFQPLDIDNINRMAPGATKYALFPATIPLSIEQKYEWMDDKLKL